MEAVPPLDGTRPYQQIPFQYSLHIQSEKDGPVIHKEFLADPSGDARLSFTLSLLQDLSIPGTVVAYNAGFEMRILKNLAVDFPQVAGGIEKLLSNVADLMMPFRNKHYYHPEFKGSYSIKEVLPVLVPELSYQSLQVRDGAMAGMAWLQCRQSTDNNEIASLRKSLLEYCRMDTLAMVKILEKLFSLV